MLAKKTSIIILAISLFSLGILIGILINSSDQLNKFWQRDIRWFLNFILSQKASEEIFSPGGLPKLEDKGFFEKVESMLISEKQSFIKADLSLMKLSYYQEGKLSKEYPILSKGKEGSWWETPTGLYQIELKKERHFSSIGRVWMPHALAFQGNFFIHGETYYPGGRPTTLTFTGGCIRLKTKDAKELYQLVKIGTPVLIFDQKFKKDNFVYQLKIPEVSAKNYLAVDLKNNFVFLEKIQKKQYQLPQ